MTHERCRQAAYHALYTRWECSACGEPIAWGSAGGGRGVGVALARGLWRRPVEHDGLRTYGLGDRARLRGDPSRRLDKRKGGAMITRGIELYVYCPRPGCGTGQHVTLTA